MTSEQAYQKYLVLSESNATTNNLSTDRGRFAIKFNLSQNKVVEWLIESNGTDENRYLQRIKVPYKMLDKFPKEHDTYSAYKIPTDYFDFIDLRVLAQKGNCKSQEMTSHEVKGANVNQLYHDKNREPSFKYRETFYTISDSNVQVYKKDFKVEKTEMYYYRYPVQVNLEDEDDPESKFLTGQLEFNDKLLNRIILSTVALNNLSTDDPKYQAFKQETIQKF